MSLSYSKDLTDDFKSSHYEGCQKIAIFWHLLTTILIFAKCLKAYLQSSNPCRKLFWHSRRLPNLTVYDFLDTFWILTKIQAFLLQLSWDFVSRFYGSCTYIRCKEVFAVPRPSRDGSSLTLCKNCQKHAKWSLYGVGALHMVKTIFSGSFPLT